MNSRPPNDNAEPEPATDDEPITLAYGGGGRLMRRLLETVILPAFSNPELDRQHDGARLAAGGSRMAMTTDGYVVSPLFFPGGDIGALCVHGAVNDLAMCGARAEALSLSFIIEEGLPLSVFKRIVRSIADAAAAAGVNVITGDTKVVERGKADQIYITTTAVGALQTPATIGPEAVRPGDQIILSGDIGRHAIAVMAEREGLAFETTIESDSALVHDAALLLLKDGLPVHCLRDLTRGGLATALIEIAAQSRVDITIDEQALPIAPPVANACDLLGLDPLYCANEGRFVVIAPRDQSDQILMRLRMFEVSAGARVIGEMSAGDGRVRMKTAYGAHRPLELLSGEQLPRIC